MAKRHLRLSVSKAKTFDQCRKKFYYQYILKLPTILKDYNAIGSLVHFILEYAFKKWILEEYKSDLKLLIIEGWRVSRETKEWKDAVVFNVTDKAKAYIMEYYRKYIEEQFKFGKPIHCEANFNLPIQIGSDLDIDIVGFIDRIDRVDRVNQ